MLARREHSRAELTEKLRPHADEGDDLDALLDGLEAAGYLSDARFAEQLANRHRGRHGPRKLEYVLRSKGVAGDEIARVVADARSDEAGAAAAVLRRRFGVPADSAEARARQMRFLSNRGFGADAIRQAIRRLEEDVQGGGET